MRELERRIRALEERLDSTAPDALPQFVFAFVHGGAFSGEPHYAWVAEDLSDLIERRAYESAESFQKRARGLTESEEWPPAYHLAPRPEEWGLGERTPELFQRLGVPSRACGSFQS